MVKISVLQLARMHRERLNNARTAIFKQQNELQAKLDAIDSELRAIAAYEIVKNGKSSLGSTVPSRPCSATIC
jgi:hypothetical protein